MIGPNEVSLPATPAAVRGVPHQAGEAPVTGVPDTLDPADPHYGYASRGWDVVRMAATGGPALWSATIRPPDHAGPGSHADLSLQQYTGYLIATGGKQGQDIAAVSTQGKVGPVCTLPPFDASGASTALLPHAGIIITANPTSPGQAGKDYWLDGYSTATGKRLWSVDTLTRATGQVNLVVSGDMVYVWQEQTGKIAAYNARTGHQSWLTGSGTLAALVPGNGLLGVSDGRVFATADESQSSRIEALNSSDGKLLWKRDLPEPALRGSITVSQAGTDVVAVSGAGSKDYLLSADIGATLSSLPVKPGADPPRPVSAYGQPAVAVVEKGAIGVLSYDPSQNRTIPIPSGKRVDVAVADSVAYVRVEKAGAPVYGYDLATGKQLWKVQVPKAPAEDSLYAFDGGFAVIGSAAAFDATFN